MNSVNLHMSMQFTREYLEILGYALFRRLLSSSQLPFGVRCLHFGTLQNHVGNSGASQGTILAPRDHPGRPYDQQDGREVVWNRFSIDSRVMLGFHFDYFQSYLSKKAWNFVFA